MEKIETATKTEKDIWDNIKSYGIHSTFLKKPIDLRTKQDDKLIEDKIKLYEELRKNLSPDNEIMRDLDETSL